MKRDLTDKRCKPCDGGVDPLSRDEATALLKKLDDWTLAEDCGYITKAFEFKDFHHVMAFANAVAWISHREDHHPDLEVGYNRCVVRYATHDIGGLSENDFICAAKVDNL